MLLAGDSGSDLLLVSRPATPTLWTPERGPSGLLVVACARPLLAVVGHRVVECTSAWAHGSAGADDHRRERTSVTLGGLIIISTNTRSEPTQVIGHPDLATGASVRQGDTLYVSVAEAVYRQGQGDEVDIHLISTAEDDAALAGFRSRARKRWEDDRLPDGWTRPLHPPVPRTEAPLTARPKEEPPRPGGDFDDLPEELRTLAEQLRAKSAARSHAAEPA